MLRFSCYKRREKERAQPLFVLQFRDMKHRSGWFVCLQLRVVLTPRHVVVLLVVVLPHHLPHPPHHVQGEGGGGCLLPVRWGMHIERERAPAPRAQGPLSTSTLSPNSIPFSFSHLLTQLKIH